MNFKNLSLESIGDIETDDLGNPTNMGAEPAVVVEPTTEPTETPTIEPALLEEPISQDLEHGPIEPGTETVEIHMESFMVAFEDSQVAAYTGNGQSAGSTDAKPEEASVKEVDPTIMQRIRMILQRFMKWFKELLHKGFGKFYNAKNKLGEELEGVPPGEQIEVSEEFLEYTEFLTSPLVLKLIRMLQDATDFSDERESPSDLYDLDGYIKELNQFSTKMHSKSDFVTKTVSAAAVRQYLMNLEKMAGRFTDEIHEFGRMESNPKFLEKRTRIAAEAFESRLKIYSRLVKFFNTAHRLASEIKLPKEPVKEGLATESQQLAMEGMREIGHAIKDFLSRVVTYIRRFIRDFLAEQKAVSSGKELKVDKHVYQILTVGIPLYRKISETTEGVLGDLERAARTKNYNYQHIRGLFTELSGLFAELRKVQETDHDQASEYTTRVEVFAVNFNIENKINAIEARLKGCLDKLPKLIDGVEDTAETTEQKELLQSAFKIIREVCTYIMKDLNYVFKAIAAGNAKASGQKDVETPAPTHRDEVDARARGFQKSTESYVVDAGMFGKITLESLSDF